MFGKLLKHEWRATAPTLGLLNLAVVGTGTMCAVLLWAMFKYGEAMNEIAGLSLTMTLLFAILAMIGCAFAVEIVQLVRFYKSRFTDEGYLMFTLPVSSHHVFLSAFVNMLIWTVITAVAVIVSYALICLAVVDGLDKMGVMEMFDEIMEMFTSEYDFTALTIIQTVVGALYSIVVALTCVTIGAVAAKKHKVLAAFGAYYAISFVTSTVSSMLTVATSVNNMDYYLSAGTDVVYQATVQNMVFTIVWELLLMVGGYFLSTWLMKRKLNLP